MTSTKTSVSLIRILIVDDHPVFRIGLANLLASVTDFLVVGQFANGDAAMHGLHSLRPHIILLDLSMPGIGGFEILRRLRDKLSDVKVLVLTSSESPDDAARALAAGAAGYLTKHVDHDEIVAVIRDIHRGAAWVQRGVARRPAAQATDRLPFGISARELEVLGFVRNGFSNVEIGRMLGITERTVKAHVKALCEKLDAADRAEAVAKGFDLGLLKTAGKP